jgi:hypothetical protein
MSKLIDSPYKVSSQVARVLAALGIGRDELAEMVKRAAITTHERGNRRYHNWLFSIEGDTVRRMTTVEETTISRPGKEAITVYDEHDDCDGLGCAGCGFIGEVRIEYSPRAIDKPKTVL